MEEKRYTVTLADGTRFENLRLNGDNFISTAKIAEDDFTGKMQTVIIEDGNEVQTLSDCELVQVARYGKEYWFIIRQLSKDELKFQQLRADVDYMAMMTDTDI